MMENPEKINDLNSEELSFAVIWNFLQKNLKKIALVGAFSLVAVLILIIAVYCFVPRVNGYRTSLSLTLPYKNDAFSYPSGKIFSSADLISRPVLRKVYKDVGLEKTVPFEKFVNSFYIAQTSMKKAFLDANYQAKMSARNINAVQLSKLEQAYQEALAAIKSSKVTIVMDPTFTVNSVLAARILNAIPQAWFDIYSVQEAAHYPTPVPEQQIQALAKGIGQEGQLILMEKSRLYCRQLLSMCSFLNNMLQGRNIALPSGEMLGDIQNRLAMVERYQINVLQMYVLEHPEFYGPFDRVFLESRVKNVEYDLQRMKGKYEGVIAAMNALVSDGTPQRTAQPLDSKSVAPEGGAAAGIAPVTLQLDAGFFSSIAQLIRNDINSDLRRTLAEKTMAYRDDWAELEAEFRRYQEILDIVNGKKPVRSQVNVGKDRFYAMVREMIAEMYTLCSKIKQFRELVLREEHTSRQFCTQDAEVLAFSAPMLPIARIALGLLAVWALLNCVYLFVLFQFRKGN